MFYFSFFSALFLLHCFKETSESEKEKKLFVLSFSSYRLAFKTSGSDDVSEFLTPKDSLPLKWSRFPVFGTNSLLSVSRFFGSQGAPAESFLSLRAAEEIICGGREKKSFANLVKAFSIFIFVIAENGVEHPNFFILRSAIGSAHFFRLF